MSRYAGLRLPSGARIPACGEDQRADSRRLRAASRLLDAVDFRGGPNAYFGDKLLKWKGNLFVSGLRTGEIPGTGRLDRVLLNDKLEELRRERCWPIRTSAFAT